MGAVCAARLNTVRREPQMKVLSEKICVVCACGSAAAGYVAIIVNFKMNDFGLYGAACVGEGDEGFAPFLVGTCIILAGNLSLAARASEVLSGDGARVCGGGRGRLNGAMQKV